MRACRTATRSSSKGVTGVAVDPTRLGAEYWPPVLMPGSPWGTEADTGVAAALESCKGS
jgi:hypothetical protein